MTYDEWHDYAEDLTSLIYVAKALVYELEDEVGAVQLLLQPQRPVDVTALPWPKRKVREHEAALH